MPTPGEGAIGSLDWPSEERKRMALISRQYCCDECGEVKEIEEENMQGHDEKDSIASEEGQDLLKELHIHSIDKGPSGSDPKQDETKDFGDGGPLIEEETKDGGDHEILQERRPKDSVDSMLSFGIFIVSLAILYKVLGYMMNS